MLVTVESNWYLLFFSRYSTAKNDPSDVIISLAIFLKMASVIFLPVIECGSATGFVSSEEKC